MREITHMMEEVLNGECPICGETDVESTLNRLDDGSAREEVAECSSCGAKWSIIYVVSTAWLIDKGGMPDDHIEKALEEVY